MNILVSRYNTANISLLIAYISLFPEERGRCRILASSWSCESLRHMFSSVSPVLDVRSDQDILQSIEATEEIIPGLYASAARCQRLKQLADADFTGYAMCVNPQLFKLMEEAMA